MCHSVSVSAWPSAASPSRTISSARSKIGSLITLAAGNDSPDTVQAFEFPDREPVAVSQKLELNGNVTALWTAQNGENAIAVFRDADNGNYEADLLNLACVQ